MEVCGGGRHSPCWEGPHSMAKFERKIWSWINKSSLAAMCGMTGSRETEKTRIPFQTWKLYRRVHACTHVHAHTDIYTDIHRHTCTHAHARKDGRKLGKVTLHEACFGYTETCYLFHKFLYLSVHI